MTRACCAGEGRTGRLARRLSGAAASVLPGAALLALPKCPLCLAVWLTATTGTGMSAAAAGHVREAIVLVWIAVVAVMAAQILRRRA